MLGKLLGKSFFAAKKQPIPIRITRNQALSSAERQIRKVPDSISYNHFLGRIARCNVSLDNGRGGSMPSDRTWWYLDRMERTEDMTASKSRNKQNDDDDSPSSLPPTTAFADNITYNLVLHTQSSNIGHWKSNPQGKMQSA